MTLVRNLVVLSKLTFSWLVCIFSGHYKKNTINDDYVNHILRDFNQPFINCYYFSMGALIKFGTLVLEKGI